MNARETTDERREVCRSGRSVPRDTTPEMHELQTAMLREAGFRRRFDLCVSMTRSAMRQWRREFDRLNPGMDGPRRLRAVVRALYGQDIHSTLFGKLPIHDGEG